jgi:hypothetical protein
LRENEQKKGFSGFRGRRKRSIADHRQEDAVMEDKLLKTGPTNILRVVAWVDLVVSGIAAIVVWDTSTNSSGVGLGFAILFQGIFVCIMFLVIASAGDNIAVIRRNSEFLNPTKSNKERVPTVTHTPTFWTIFNPHLSP